MLLSFGRLSDFQQQCFCYRLLSIVLIILLSCFCCCCSICSLRGDIHTYTQVLVHLSLCQFRKNVCNNKTRGQTLLVTCRRRCRGRSHCNAALGGNYVIPMRPLPHWQATAKNNNSSYSNCKRCGKKPKMLIIIAPRLARCNNCEKHCLQLSPRCRHIPTLHRLRAKPK